MPRMSVVWAAALAWAMTVGAGAQTMDADTLTRGLIPRPRELRVEAGSLPLSGRAVTFATPAGAEHDACREVLRGALTAMGAKARASAAPGIAFTIGKGADLPGLPDAGIAEEGYVLAIGPEGAAALARTARGLLYAAETLRQIARMSAEGGALPCVVVRDSPDMRMRGIYIEGGQERYGRIVSRDYLCEQIRRLAQFKMNTLVVECYNLFPYASFAGCADAGTLSREDCQAVFAEAKRWHVTMVPSLQTLAQAYELVWANEAGAKYREASAPGLICPSNPDVYPFIKALYRDLLTWFPDAPVIGVGCSEIDMQWQGRYCPACKARVEKGETVRDLLLGHAEKCIRAVEELAQEMHRPVRPMIWGDEFYMYGPGRDWVGLERIAKNTVMGFWKYWPDYAGIGGLMDRGYDIFGISAIYNHCFYLADLSPEDPKKSWPSMEQTGILNIDGMARDAAAAQKKHPSREFLGIATASFSKHRVRAFDSLWYGFAQNALCTWRLPDETLDEYQPAFTRAFVRHYYDARTDEATERLATAYERLDRCKSALELANQTLHDVVGVVDTQEAGYIGNTVLGAWQRCRELMDREGRPGKELAAIRSKAEEIDEEATAIEAELNAMRSAVGRRAELADLELAARKIGHHAERQMLMIDGQSLLAKAPGMALANSRRLVKAQADHWRRHEKEVADILRQVSPLYSQGDPTGFRSVLQDVTAIADHFQRLAEHGPASPGATAGRVVLDEPFASLDTARWEVLGHPRVADGHLETQAPGGWGKLCGVLSREAFRLDAAKPLVLEFELTPVKLGVDSQLVAAADKPTDISFKFALAASHDHFAVHTQSSADLAGTWTDGAKGWKQRAVSPEIKPGDTYHVRAEITRTTWRVVMRRDADGPWDMPWWDTGAVPMDQVPSTRLVFTDIEPEGSTAATRWGPIRVSR